MIGSRLRPTNLHLSHFWGGGTEAWVEDFAAADELSNNLVLQSLGSYECYGIRFRLLHVNRGQLLGEWVLQHPISEVSGEHSEYAALLRQICQDFEIDHIYVSSLIGHSCDIFRLGIACTKVYHDYFPYCPAFFITRDGLCTSCGQDELEECKEWDTSHRPKSSPSYYASLRETFFDAVAAGDVRHVSPSRSVPDNLRRLDRRWRDIKFEIIEHGISHNRVDAFGGAEDGRRLRVGLLGLLGWNKGREIVREKFDILRTIADIHILGAEEAGAEYEGRWGASFVHHYEKAYLAELLTHRRLDLLLFLSQVPETFSYTLSEAWCFCIPPAARRIGAQAERIEEGRNGFLFGLEDDAVVDFLLWADRERNELRRLAARLREKPIRTVKEAICDYYRLRPDYTRQLRSRLAQAV